MLFIPDPQRETRIKIYILLACLFFALPLLLMLKELIKLLTLSWLPTSRIHLLLQSSTLGDNERYYAVC